MSAERPTLDIEVWFDFICPWCLIGKRNLAVALEQLRETQPNVDCRIRWRSLPLLPDIPAAGVPYRDFYLRRLGSPEAVAARRMQVQAAAHAAGFEIPFDRLEVMPSTLAAHRLVAAAEANNLDVAGLVDAFFTAYFMDASNIGDPAVLTRIGVDAGLDAGTVAAYLAANGTSRAPPPQPLDHGVPFFVFGGLVAVAGAQAPVTLLAAARKALTHSKNTFAGARTRRHATDGVRDG